MMHPGPIRASGKVSIGGRWYIAVLIVAALALGATVWMRQSITLDEAQSIWQTSRSLGGVFDVIAKDVHVPVYFVLLHYWETFFGTSLTSIRLLSLIFFVASIPAIYLLAKEAYTPKVAYIVALMTVVSPFLNWYGSDARMYSLMFLLAVSSHLFFMRLWKHPDKGSWVGYSVVTIVGVFTHLFFVFILVVQAGFFVMRRRLFEKEALGRFGAIAAVAGAGTVAWLVYRSLAGAGLTDPLLKRPASIDFFNVFSNFFLGFQIDIVNTFVLSLWPLIVFVGFTLLAKRRSYGPETFYLTLSSFVPLGLAFVVSATLQPIFLSRYLLVCLPSLYILVAYLLSTYKGWVADAALSTLVFVMLAMLAVQAIEPDSPVKENFRAAASYVENDNTPSDLFVVSAPFITYPIEYYYSGAARLTTFPEWDRYSKDAAPKAFSADDLASTTAAWAKVYNRVYVLLGYDQGYNDKIRLYMDTHYERLDMKTFSPGLTLYVYKLRYS